MDTIFFKGKEYKSRTFTMHSEETGEMENTIAELALQEAILANPGKAATQIDEGIYFFVEPEILELEPEEICAKHLDIPFELVSVED